MSKRTLSISIAVALGFLQTASAQSVFNPQNSPVAPRPALSPYLNLLRGGDPAANYYLGVLPEQGNRAFQANTMNLLAPSTLPYVDQFVDDRADVDFRERQLPPTGHTAGFMIYNSYYRVPNQRSFIPYNPNVNNPANRQQLR